jgi:hypothetical protein
MAGMEGFSTLCKDHRNHLIENSSSSEQRKLQTTCFGTQSNSTLHLEHDALVTREHDFVYIYN